MNVSNSYNATTYTGGIVGDGQSCKVENCWSEMTLLSTNNYLSTGGICGELNGGAAHYIKDCVALNPQVWSGTAITNIRRVTGQLYNSATVQNCFALPGMTLSTDGGTTPYTVTTGLSNNNEQGADFGAANTPGSWTAGSPTGPGWTFSPSAPPFDEGNPWVWGGSRPKLWFE
jgi:hypothetical protein